MLPNTIPAYPYVEYQDDDDVQALFAAFNGAAQVYVSWFATVGLPFYPGLTGALLDWVAQGVYGLARTALESQVTPGLGPLNTEPFNVAPLNSYVFPTQTFYSLTDDVFGRILTWDFYKADGKRFCARWLKRRVMRFLAWPNGVQPDPVVGPENTQAISVQITGGVCTVNISQGMVSLLVPGLPPNLLPIFQAAFQGGNLELPAQYTYVCNIQTHPVAMASPPAESVLVATAAVSSGAVVVTATAGSGIYTFAWTWSSGGAGITINSNTSAITTFSVSGLAPGTGDSGTALCTVTDTVTSLTAAVSVPVSIQRATLPAITTIVPTSIAFVGSTPTQSGVVSTVTTTGGVAPYAYAWTWQSGGTGISIVPHPLPTSGPATFTATGLAPGQTDSGVALLTVTDALGQTATATVSVSLGRSLAPSASVAPTLISSTVAAATETTVAAVITASGGSPPYTYAWSWGSGGSSIAINSPTAASTTFTASGLAPGATDSGSAMCVVKDSLGQSAQATLTVSVSRTTLVAASVAPASQSSIALSGTQTTGASTVTASGGSGTYGYIWVWTSGGAGISINTAGAASTSFTATGLTAGTTRTGVAQCTVTDGYGQTAQVTVSVSIAYATPVTLSASPATLATGAAAATQTSANTTATAAGGLGPYVYAWTWASGGTGITIEYPASATTYFVVTGLSVGGSASGTAQCKATDSLGQVAVTDVPVTFFYTKTTTFTAEGATIVTIPTGATQVVIEGWGSGGAGGEPI